MYLISRISQKTGLSTLRANGDVYNLSKERCLQVAQSVSYKISPSLHITAMATSSSACVKPGTIVHLRELQPSSPFFDPSGSFRVMGRLQSYDIESGTAVISEEDGASLRVATQHLRDLHLRMGSLFQFIGELKSSPNEEIFLQARVGRNVDGIDIKLYDKALQLRRQFEAKYSGSMQR